jgi:hypothetical protein
VTEPNEFDEFRRRVAHEERRRRILITVLDVLTALALLAIAALVLKSSTSAARWLGMLNAQSRWPILPACHASQNPRSRQAGAPAQLFAALRAPHADRSCCHRIPRRPGNPDANTGHNLVMVASPTLPD